MNKDMLENLVLLNSTRVSFEIKSSLTNQQVDLTPYLFIPFIYTISYCDEDIKVLDNKILINKCYSIDFDQVEEWINHTVPLVISYCQDFNIENCKSRNETNKFLQDNRLIINYWLDSETVDAQNYNNPVPNKSINFQSGLVKEATVINKNVFTSHELFTDDEFLFSNSIKFKNTTFAIVEENLNELIYPIDAFDGTTLWMMLLNVNAKKIVYERKYEKISDVLAKVGGISNLLLNVCRIFMSFVCSLIRDERIANYLYDFDINDDQKILINNENSNMNFNGHIHNDIKIILNDEENFTPKNLEQKKKKRDFSYVSKNINNFSQINITNRTSELNRIVSNTSGIKIESSNIDKKESDLKK